MAKIKVISNPYKQLTVFQSWSQTKEEWTEINAETCPNSKLLNEDLRKGFFPFKARQIVDILIEEYCTDSERVEIIFEGTDDELENWSLFVPVEILVTGLWHLNQIGIWRMREIFSLM